MKNTKAERLMQKLRARSSSPPPTHYPTIHYISSHYVADNSHYALHPKYLTMKALSGRSLGFDTPLNLQKAQSVFEPRMIRTRSAYEKERNCQPRLTYHVIDPQTHKMQLPDYLINPPMLEPSRIINRSSQKYNDEFMNKYNVEDESDDEIDPLDLPYGSLHHPSRVHNHILGSAMKLPPCIRRSPYKHYFIHHPDISHKLMLPKKYMKDDPVSKRYNPKPDLTPRKTNIMNTKWKSGPSYSKDLVSQSAYGGFPQYESYVVREVPGQPPEMLTFSYDVAKMPRVTT